MKLKVTLPGSIRSKKNSKRIYGAGKFKRVLPSKAYLAWEKRARAAIYYRHEITQDNILKASPISINAQIYYKGQKPDLSGCLESIGDAMEGFLWANDKQIYSWDGSRLHHDKKNPRTELTVEYKEVLTAGFFPPKPAK